MRPSLVNTHEAKTHFSKLLARVAQGEKIIVAKSGKPVARLLPYEEPECEIAFSAASAWEISTKICLGKLPLPTSIS